MSEQNEFPKNERPTPAAWADNPFQAPGAHVEDVRRAGDGALLDEPNRLTAGRGSAWWSGGWSLFRKASGLWIGITIAMIILMMLLTVIPVLGPLATYILMPVLSGGLMLGCHSLQSDEGLSFGHLFAGFQRNFGQLALVGLLYLVGFVVVMLILFVAFGGAFAMAVFGGSARSGAALSTLIFGVVLAFTLITPLAMSIWFAPALVMLNEIPAAQAMKLSFLGCWRNVLPFLVYGLIAIALMFAATIPFALGWLVLIPTGICSSYRAYREIYLADRQ